MRVLVTGSTGLVGYEVVEALKECRDFEVAKINRHGSANGECASRWVLGQEPPSKDVLRSWDAVINTAADLRWTMSEEEAWRANVVSVEALSSVVGRNTHVVHVSTAYAGGIRGDAQSDQIADYHNSYEWSKAASERAARRLFRNLTIIRPPLIIGRTADGRARGFSGMYTILRGIAVSLVPALVAEKDAFSDIVPVDAVAEAIVNSVREGPRGEAEVKTIGSGERAPRFGDAINLIVGELNCWRTENGLPPFDVPRLLSPEQWNRFFFPFARQHLSRRQLQILELLRNFEPYATPPPSERSGMCGGGCDARGCAWRAAEALAFPSRNFSAGGGRGGTSGATRWRRCGRYQRQYIRESKRRPELHAAGSGACHPICSCRRRQPR